MRPIAVGGDYSPSCLIWGYKKGWFPWGEEKGNILWYCPDPRAVIFPSHIKIAESMRQVFKKNIFSFTADRAFRQVIEDCRAVREEKGESTWISDSLIAGYCRLHDMGIAHSIEVWDGCHLVGGLYGISLGKMFYGESMFFRKSNASKAALIALCTFLHSHHYALIDCQVYNSHLGSMGAVLIPGRDFLKIHSVFSQKMGLEGKWTNYFEEWIKNQNKIF